MGGGGEGLGLLTFMTMYIEMRFVRLFAFDRFLQKKHFWIAVFLFLVGVLAFSVIPAWIKHNETPLTQCDWYQYTTYNSPHCIVMSIVMLLYFIKYVRLPKMVSRVAISVAPLMFGVYILHNAIPLGHELYRVPQSLLVRHTNLPSFVIVSATAVFTFLSCLVFEWARYVLLRPLTTRFNRIIAEIDAKLGFA